MGSSGSTGATATGRSRRRTTALPLRPRPKARRAVHRFIPAPLQVGHEQVPTYCIGFVTITSSPGPRTRWSRRGAGSRALMLPPGGNRPCSTGSSPLPPSVLTVGTTRGVCRARLPPGGAMRRVVEPPGECSMLRLCREGQHSGGSRDEDGEACALSRRTDGWLLHGRGRGRPGSTGSSPLPPSVLKVVTTLGVCRARPSPGGAGRGMEPPGECSMLRLCREGQHSGGRVGRGRRDLRAQPGDGRGTTARRRARRLAATPWRGGRWG